jgi:tripartite-type tricarboxylate transporter receptor subunit TctC
MGGHIDAVCCSIPEASSQIESGVLRVLAVMSAERHPDHPDVPTVKESGVDWEAVGWRGLMLPKGAPDEIVNQLTQKLEKILTSEAYIEFMNKFGYGITVRGPAEFKSFLGQQDEQWKSVIEAVGYDKK